MKIFVRRERLVRGFSPALPTPLNNDIIYATMIYCYWLVHSGALRAGAGVTAPKGITYR